MRGVVTAGMAAALERHGLAGGFDLVAGASAGAINGAALIGGVAAGCVVGYHTAFATREFINPLRLLRGRPALDRRLRARYHASDALDADRHARTVAQPRRSCTASRWTSTRRRPSTSPACARARSCSRRCSPRAGSRGSGGDPVEIGGRRYRRRRLDRGDPGGDGDRRGSDPRAGAADPPAPGSRARARSPGGRPPDHAAPAPAQPRAGRPVSPPRSEVYEEVVADIGRRSADPGRRAAARARPAPAGRDAAGRPARAPRRRPRHRPRPTPSAWSSRCFFFFFFRGAGKASRDAAQGDSLREVRRWGHEDADERSVACGAHHRLLVRHRPRHRLRLVKAGWTVYATARRPETLAALEADGCRTLALDVVDEASRQAAVDAVVDGGGRRRRARQQRRLQPVRRRRVDPRRSGPRPVRDQRLRPARPVPAGAARDARAGVGQDRAASSMGGKLTFPGGGLYHATKHAVEAISDALRFEVKSFGVDVIVIEPGLITSGFSDAAVRGLGRRSRPEGPTWSSTARSARPRATSTRRACSPSSAVRPRRSPSASRTRSTPSAPARATRSPRRRGRC